MVCPAFISQDSQLAHVQDVFNAILVRGDATGDVLFYGKGAGKLPTASAVVSDMIDAAAMNDTCTFLYWEDNAENPVVSASEAVHSYYMLFDTKEADKLLAAAKEQLGAVTVLSRENQPENEIAFMTPAISGEKAEQFAAAVEPSAVLVNKIRVLEY